MTIAGATLCASARIVTIKNTEIEKLTDTTDITELTIEGNVATAIRMDSKNFPNLKKLTYKGDVYMIGAHSFEGCPKLETVEFQGLVGHSDGYCFFDCPELRTVTFSGPVLCTGGPLYLQNCRKAEKVVMKGLVVGSSFGENEMCPNFKGYETDGALLYGGTLKPTPDKVLLKKKESLMPQAKQLSAFIEDALASKHEAWHFKIANRYQPILKHLLSLYDAEDLAAGWKLSGKFADPELEFEKLTILKNAKPYSPGSSSAIDFKYAHPSDSMLTATRIRFNLDSVAGNGDEISRMKNLLHFTHEAVRHDGSSAWPNVPINFGALYDICKRENRGINCRLMAIMLTEALLAEGIPARYLTCVPKHYDIDQDCHVIVAAWSKDLNKWVWLDPTFDAWVTDENGTLLGPAEVRERLIADKPLILNEDANWNHQEKQTADHYLKYYMAKNLYLIGCNTINRPEPEGRMSIKGKQGRHIFLVPEGFNYSHNDTMNDPDVFWAAPEEAGK